MVGDFNSSKFDDFILSNGVIGFFREPVKLKSGRVSCWYANFRTPMEDVFLCEKMGEFVIDFCYGIGLRPDSFVGVSEGATKLGLITQYFNATMCPDYCVGSHSFPMIRGKPKEHGDAKDRYFLGKPRGETVILEDVTTTGESLIEDIDKLRDCGGEGEIVAAVGLFNRNQIRDDGLSVRDAVNQTGIPYLSLSDAHGVLPKAYELLDPGEDVGRVIEEEFRLFGTEPIILIKD